MTTCPTTMRDRGLVRNGQRHRPLPATTEAIAGTESEPEPAPVALILPAVS
jgi:hypothetical protein